LYGSIHSQPAKISIRERSGIALEGLKAYFLRIRQTFVLLTLIRPPDQLLHPQKIAFLNFYFLRSSDRLLLAERKAVLEPLFLLVMLLYVYLRPEAFFTRKAIWRKSRRSAVSSL